MRAAAAKRFQDQDGLDRTDLRLWLRLLTCTHGVETEIKTRMKGQFGITLTQFNLMAQLDRAPDGIRMGELSRRTMVTGSNVTVVIDDLVRRGLAQRRSEAADRRAIAISLTEAGRQEFARVAPHHEGWIREMFDSMPVERKHTLIDALDDLKAALKMTLRNSL